MHWTSSYKVYFELTNTGNVTLNPQVVSDTTGFSKKRVIKTSTPLKYSISVNAKLHREVLSRRLSRIKWNEK